MMLRRSDAGPMLVNVLLILVGTPAAVWLLANPDVMTDLQQRVSDYDVIWNLVAVLAIQPLMVIFWFWMKRRQGPFTIERQQASGLWEKIAKTDSLRHAKELAHDTHRRVRNLQGDVIFTGYLPAQPK